MNAKFVVRSIAEIFTDCDDEREDALSECLEDATEAGVDLEDVGALLHEEVMDHGWQIDDLRTLVDAFKPFGVKLKFVITVE